MNMQIERLIKKYRLQRVNRTIHESTRPAFHIAKAPGASSFPGRSHFGGLPDVTDTFVWPRWDDRPLGFIAQINCQEVPQTEFLRVLPPTGILYFFYDLCIKPAGYAPEHRGSAIVLYEPGDVCLKRASVPDECDANDVTLRQYNADFKLISTIPHTDSDAFEEFHLASDEWDRYIDLYYALRKQNTGGEPSHQVLGHPRIVQNDMRLECQLASNGIDCGGSSGYSDPRRQDLASGASDWRLLLQVDSDEDLGEIWEDSGLLYYWIRMSKLQKCDFSDGWVILQSA